MFWGSGGDGAVLWDRGVFSGAASKGLRHFFATCNVGALLALVSVLGATVWYNFRYPVFPLRGRGTRYHFYGPRSTDLVQVLGLH